MRALPPRLLGLVAVLAVAALPLVGAGAAPATRLKGGPPPERRWQRDCARKPMPPVGAVALSILDRPTHDTALVVADWRQGPFAEKGPATLELVLPDGAYLAEGGTEVSLPRGLAAGSGAWLVRFPTDRTSDLAVRLRVDTEDGPQSREFYVRLWEVAPGE